MDIYKKLKAGRKKQVLHICEKMAESEHPTDEDDHMSLCELMKLLDDNWKNLFPIIDIHDAIKVCKRVWKKIFVLDVDSTIDIIDLIFIYSHLEYLNEFMNESIIQNSYINEQYEYIKDFVFRFECGLDYIKIKY